MRKNRTIVRRTFVLDCDYANWFNTMRAYIRWQGEMEAHRVYSTQPFTFNDVHPVIAAADRYVVLRPNGEVKS